VEFLSREDVFGLRSKERARRQANECEYNMFFFFYQSYIMAA
jgi:hypothetical protein